MTSVFGHPAGTSPRHGRVWYWSRRRLDRFWSIARGLRTVTAFLLGMLCVVLAGKVIGPALEASPPRLAPAATAATETVPPVAPAPVLAAAPAAGATAAKPATVGAGTAEDPARARTAQRSTVTETDGRATAPASEELAGLPKEQAAAPTPSGGEQPKPAPEAAQATTERPDVDTVPAPAKQASHKTKQRHVTRQYRNSWDANNRWNNYNRYSQSQWGYARETQQQQWRSW